VKFFRAEPTEIQTGLRQTTSHSPHNQAENSPPSFKTVG